jgi:hypothetical protein
VAAPFLGLLVCCGKKNGEEDGVRGNFTRDMKTDRFLKKNVNKWLDWHLQVYARIGVAFFKVSKLQWHFSEL